MAIAMKSLVCYGTLFTVKKLVGLLESHGIIQSLMTDKANSAAESFIQSLDGVFLILDCKNPGSILIVNFLLYPKIRFAFKAWGRKEIPRILIESYFGKKV